MKTIFLSILILSASLSSFAYQDIIWTHKDQNVQTRVNTGSTIVEIRNKAIILTRLIQSTSNRLDYNKTIIINIDHDYTNRDSSKALVGYTNKDIYSRKEFSEFSSNRKCLRVYLRLRDIDYREVIQIIEQCVKNIDILKSKDYAERNERDPTSHLVDINELPKVENTTELFNNIKCEKVNRTIGDSPSDMSFSTSYYYECNEYHLYGLTLQKKNYEDRKDTLVVKTVPSVFQVARLSYHSAVIFDTDSTFYFLRNSHHTGPEVSKRHSISPTHGNYMPFEVTKVDDYVFIQFGGFLEGGGTFNRLLAYIIEEDKLIQDVKSKIENN